VLKGKLVSTKTFLLVVKTHVNCSCNRFFSFGTFRSLETPLMEVEGCGKRVSRQQGW